MRDKRLVKLIKVALPTFGDLIGNHISASSGDDQ